MSRLEPVTHVRLVLLIVASIVLASMVSGLGTVSYLNDEEEATVTFAIADKFTTASLLGADHLLEPVKTDSWTTFDDGSGEWILASLGGGEFDLEIRADSTQPLSVAIPEKPLLKALGVSTFDVVEFTLEDGSALAYEFRSVRNSEYMVFTLEHFSTRLIHIETASGPASTLSTVGVTTDLDDPANQTDTGTDSNTSTTDKSTTNGTVDSTTESNLTATNETQDTTVNETSVTTEDPVTNETSDGSSETNLSITEPDETTDTTSSTSTDSTNTTTTETGEPTQEDGSTSTMDAGSTNTTTDESTSTSDDGSTTDTSANVTDTESTDQPSSSDTSSGTSDTTDTSTTESTVQTTDTTSDDGSGETNTTATQSIRGVGEPLPLSAFMGR